MRKINESVGVFDVDVTGRNSYAVSKTGLKVGSHVMMRDDRTQDSDLKDFIKFGEEGFVRSIELIKNYSSDEESEGQAHTYDYRINVIAAGPKKGWGKLIFIDRTTDHYELSIYDSSEKQHYVRYNSTYPDIIAILWSDDNN